MGILRYINIKAPKSMNDLRIEHLQALTNPKFTTGELDLNDIIEFLSVLTSGTVNELKKVNISELKDIYVHCIGLFENYKVTEPEKEIEVLGQKYELVDPKKVGVGWHIDVSNSDMQANPARLVALMYIEKGTNYGDLDQNGNMIYSNQEREKIFKQHIPLPIYLNVVSFFFATINRINRELYGEPKEDETKTDKKSTRYTWEKVIHFLSKEYNTSWEDIVKWNVYKFNHRLNFINFEKQQEIKTIQRGSRS